MNTPKETAQQYIGTGASKTKLPTARMFLLGILAGAFIALAGVGATTASVSIASASVARLVGACIFPVGLIMVLLAGSELFTGNCLLIIPVMERKSSVVGMLKNWLFVYLGNLVGSIIVAALCNYGHTFSLFGGALAGSVINTAAAKVGLSFGDAFCRGILCNFLVCIAVWISFASKDMAGKIAGMYFPVMLFVLCGFEHSVANMYYISAGLFAKYNPAYLQAATADVSGLTWGNFFTKNLIPVTLGNIVGGSICVGLAYWFIYLREKEKAEVTR